MFRTRWLVVAVGVALTCGAYAGVAQAQDVGQKTAPITMHGYDGHDQFNTYCASCHGRTAKGDGVVGAILKKKPPDLTTFAERNGGKFDEELLYRIIDGRKQVSGHGGPDMPVWGDAFSKSAEGSSPTAVKERIDAIVRWLARMQQKPASE